MHEEGGLGRLGERLINSTSINVESHVLPLLLRNLEGNHHNHVLLLSLLCNLEGN